MKSFAAANLRDNFSSHRLFIRAQHLQTYLIVARFSALIYAAIGIMFVALFPDSAASAARRSAQRTHAAHSRSAHIALVRSIRCVATPRAHAAIGNAAESGNRFNLRAVFVSLCAAFAALFPDSAAFVAPPTHTAPTPAHHEDI